jgi:hypothetical protein
MIAIDGQADGSAADHDRDVFLGDLRAAHGVPGDGHGLGQCGGLGWQAVGDRKRERLLDDKPLGVGARGFCGEPDGVHVLAASHQRHGDNRGA